MGISFVNSKFHQQMGENHRLLVLHPVRASSADDFEPTLPMTSTNVAAIAKRMRSLQIPLYQIIPAHKSFFI
jgi:hypothetical protein